MFKKILQYLFKDFYIFSAAYSNNIFPDPLSKEEEDKFIEQAKLGDKEARNKLIEHNLRLVAHIVKKYDHSKEETDDLISIGTIGLIKGIDSFSYKHGTRKLLIVQDALKMRYLCTIEIIKKTVKI